MCTFQPFNSQLNVKGQLIPMESSCVTKGGERHFVTFKFISEYNKSAGSQVGITSVAGILCEAGWIWMSYEREGSDLATTQSHLPARVEIKSYAVNVISTRAGK